MPTEGRAIGAELIADSEFGRRNTVCFLETNRGVEAGLLRCGIDNDQESVFRESAAHSFCEKRLAGLFGLF